MYANGQQQVEKIRVIKHENASAPATTPQLAKTPVSLLQELCMRRGISPKYDLLQIEGAVHEPTFVYRVTVGEYAANGSGQSKKKAKHAAAKAVLDLIIQGGTGNSGSARGNNAVNLTAQIVSPYDDGIPGNPVGALQELCMARRWPPPSYDLAGEEGFPHERIFGIICLIGNFKERGEGKSKKMAKRQAAYKMMQRLKDQPVELPPINMFADDDDENVSLNSSVIDFMRMLQDIADEAKFSMTYVDIEEKSISGKRQCLLQLNTMPVAVCYGSGKTVKDAQMQAAHNALEYLVIMTKK